MNKVAIRAFIGLMAGISLGYTITVLISLINGEFYPIKPILLDYYGTEIAAVVVQYLASGIVGAVMGAITLVWENENWSLLKQTIIHFCIFSVSILLAAIVSGWVDLSLKNVVLYFLFCAGWYLIIWIIEYFVTKNKITQINKKVNNQ